MSKHYNLLVESAMRMNAAFIDAKYLPGSLPAILVNNVLLLGRYIYNPEVRHSSFTNTEHCFEEEYKKLRDCGYGNPTDEGQELDHTARGKIILRPKR